MQTLMRAFGIAAIFVPLAAQAVPVTVGDREWRQVTDTAGFSWFDVATVCDVDSGDCAGALQGVDFNGWTWASLSDIGDMFRALTGYPEYDPYTNVEYYSTWAPAFLDLFAPTYIDYTSARIYGSSRDLRDGSSAYQGYVTDYFYRYDFVSTGSSVGRDSDWDGRGAWLYRSAVVTTEPSAFYLFLVGAIALAWCRAPTHLTIRSCA